MLSLTTTTYMVRGREHASIPSNDAGLKSPLRVPTCLINYSCRNMVYKDSHRPADFELHIALVRAPLDVPECYREERRLVYLIYIFFALPG
jgi:hypothetical protein